MQAFNLKLWRQSIYMNPADIGALLYSMAYIQAVPTRQQLRRVLTNFTSKLDEATGDGVCNVLLSLPQFGITTV
jgi:hypothetical protein